MFSGAENMMTDFVKAMNGAIDEKTIDPLYLRASNILVRPGNPHPLCGLRDLLRPGFKLMVVTGAAQTPLWQVMAVRAGDIPPLRALRAHIVRHASSRAGAKPSSEQRRLGKER